jgi:hypothetical protein
MQYKNISILEITCMVFCVLQCQATNEEEIFEVQDKASLFTLGWIHVSSASQMVAVDCSSWYSDF